MTCRVLITRAAADAEALAAPIRALGMQPVLVPLVQRVSYPEQVAATAARGHDGWVLTSAAVVGVLRDVSVRPAWIAAVGPATARAAERAGLTVDLVPARATAADLAEALGDRSGQTVLYPRAAVASPGTLEGLRATGAVVEDVVAYDNVEPSGAGEALAAVWPVDAVVLMSGSAARRLARHCPPPWEGVTVFAIGPRTAEAAGDVGIGVDVVADEHTVAGVVGVVRAWGGGTGSGRERLDKGRC